MDKIIHFRLISHDSLLLFLFFLVNYSNEKVYSSTWEGVGPFGVGKRRGFYHGAWNFVYEPLDMI